MKKGIELPKETIEALLNGASMFIVPIVHPCKYYSCRNQQAIRIEPENDPWYKDRNYCIREEGGGWQDFTKEDFLNYVNAPLQIGDEFYVQEPYTCGKKGENLHYEFDFANANVFDDWCDYCCTTNFEPCMMTYEQSRVKGKIINVEVKQVQNICTFDFFSNYVIEKFLCKQNINYEQNPYVLIYTVELT